MEWRWTKARPDDRKLPNNDKMWFPKFKHVYAKNAVAGHDHGIVIMKHSRRPRADGSTADPKQSFTKLVLKRKSG
jgi:hypothetical protein